MGIYSGFGEIRQPSDIEIDVRWIGEGNNSAAIVDNWLNHWRPSIEAAGFSTSASDYIGRRFSLSDAPRPGGARPAAQAAPAYQAAPSYQPAPSYQQPATADTSMVKGPLQVYQPAYEREQPQSGTIFGLPPIALIGGAGVLLFFLMKGKR